jgi:hypothetical protein
MTSLTPEAPSIASYTPPPEIANIRVFFLVSAIVNAIVTFAWLIATVAMGLATMGIGCLLIFIPFITGAVCVMDFIASSKAVGPPTSGARSFLTFVAIADILSGVFGASVVQLVMGILSLVFLNKQEVQAYYAGR